MSRASRSRDPLSVSTNAFTSKVSGWVAARVGADAGAGLVVVPPAAVAGPAAVEGAGVGGLPLPVAGTAAGVVGAAGPVPAEGPDGPLGFAGGVAPAGAGVAVAGVAAGVAVAPVVLGVPAVLGGGVGSGVDAGVDVGVEVGGGAGGAGTFASGGVARLTAGVTGRRNATYARTATPSARTAKSDPAIAKCCFRNTIVAPSTTDAAAGDFGAAGAGSGAGGVATGDEASSGAAPPTEDAAANGDAANGAGSGVLRPTALLG